jgi:hypothetical protein
VGIDLTDILERCLIELPQKFPARGQAIRRCERTDSVKLDETKTSDADHDCAWRTCLES